MTRGQLRRRRRNLVIFTVSAKGVPLKMMADVLDLRRSIVGIIMRGLRSEFERDTGLTFREAKDQDIACWAKEQARKLRMPRRQG